MLTTKRMRFYSFLVSFTRRQTTFVPPKRNEKTLLDKLGVVAGLLLIPAIAIPAYRKTRRDDLQVGPIGWVFARSMNAVKKHPRIVELLGKETLLNWYYTVDLPRQRESQNNRYDVLYYTVRGSEVDQERARGVYFLHNRQSHRVVEVSFDADTDLSREQHELRWVVARILPGEFETSPPGGLHNAILSVRRAMKAEDVEVLCLVDRFGEFPADHSEASADTAPNVT